MKKKKPHPVNVYYFDRPTIGFCKQCECSAVYRGGGGLKCPDCGTTKLSIFVWDEKSEYPE
jgi:tRNA(Ile2) C34 agmatinyltransferase TiaS